MRHANQDLLHAALAAAKRGDAATVDAIELEHIERTQCFVTLSNGDRAPGVPRRLLRGHGKYGRLAVEWGIMGGTVVYADIDGKEIPDDHEQAQDQQALFR